MTTIDDTFRLAVTHFLANRLLEAEQTCRQLLAVNPRHAEALHLVGNIALRKGNIPNAVSFIKQAIDQNPKTAAYHLSLGKAFRMSGNLDDAGACFKTATSLQPKSYEAHFNSGLVHLDSGRFENAVTSFRQAISINSRVPEIHNALGEAFKKLGKWDQAAVSCQKAIALKPDYAEAHVNLGEIEERRGKFDRALECYKQALIARPQFAAAYNNLGSLCYNQHRLEDTLDYCRQALRLDPNLVEAHINLGLALRMLGRFKEAAASMQCAVALRATTPDPYVALAMIADMEGRLADALDLYRRALEVSPNYPPALWNRSLTLLRHGRLAEGWVDYETRWLNPATFDSPRRPFSQPAWQGEDLGTGKLVVWAEQGVGDELLYSGMIPDLIARQTAFVLECDRRLVPLFKRTWPSGVIVDRRDPPAPETTDASVVRQISMASLGRWLRPSLEAVPQRARFLTPDETRREAFRTRLDNESPFGRRKPLVVGISWVSKNRIVGGQKSTALLDWEPILRETGVRFVDLQYGETTKDRAEVKKELGVEVTHFDDLDNFKDLDGLAALIAACDLVITVSNTTAHLAGALGVPVWILVSSGIGQTWYWFRDRTDSPWYPSSRLYRQIEAKSWRPAIKEIAKNLRKFPRC